MSLTEKNIYEFANIILYFLLFLTQKSFVDLSLTLKSNEFDVTMFPKSYSQDSILHETRTGWLNVQL